MDTNEPQQASPFPSLFELLGLPTPPPMDPDQRSAELEQRSQNYLRDMQRRSRIERFEHDCQKGYPVSDWQHPCLMPYRHAIDKVRRWQFGPKGLILSGPTGRGKTRSIFDLYRRLAYQEEREIRYWFAGDWFSRLQAEVHYGRDDAQGWVEAVAMHPVVIMDDLGQQAMTTARSDWAAAWFFRFLDLRIAAQLPLIVSTNLTANEIAGNFSQGTGIRQEPLMRRLLELGEVVKFEPSARE